jgi:hypothetical protein
VPLTHRCKKRLKILIDVGHCLREEERGKQRYSSLSFLCVNTLSLLFLAQSYKMLSQADVTPDRCYRYDK